MYQELSPFEVLTPNVTKVNSIVHDFKESIQTNNELREKYNDKIKKYFPTDLGKLTLSGTLCILVLLFDWVISNNTMGWIYELTKKMLPLEFIALIFSIIDAGLAVLAAGVFAKSPLEAAHQRKIFRPILWCMAVIKLALFLVLVKFSSNTNFSGSDIMFFFQIAFTALIYVILDLMGKGLAFIWDKLTFVLNTRIFHTHPDDIKKKFKTAISKLDNDIHTAGFNKDEVYDYFKLPHDPQILLLDLRR